MFSRPVTIYLQFAVRSHDADLRLCKAFKRKHSQAWNNLIIDVCVINNSIHDTSSRQAAQWEEQLSVKLRARSIYSQSHQAKSRGDTKTQK